MALASLSPGGNDPFNIALEDRNVSSCSYDSKCISVPSSLEIIFISTKLKKKKDKRALNDYLIF